MKVCIDVQPGVSQCAGVGRYIRNLVSSLGPFVKDDDLNLCYFDFKRRGSPISVPNARNRAIRWCPGRLAQLAWKTIGWPPFDMFAGAADVYHFPNFVIPPIRGGKSVVSIHDMSFVRFPQFAEDRNRKYLSQHVPGSVDKADAIITISKFSANEITQLMHASAEKVFAVYPGISPDFRPADEEAILNTRKKLGIEGPYLLCVGTLEPRKNVGFLVEVFEKLDAFDGQLVIAGMSGWKYEPILDRIRRSKRAADILRIEYVDDPDLAPLYSGADLFLTTSFYEGFGFAPLEAMACGTPAVSSDGGSLGEVLGDAAAVISGFEHDEWVSTITGTLTDSDLRQNLASRGREKAAEYSWSETARKTWDVYTSVGG